MRSAIPYYILTLLDRHGSVHVPGVGHLVRDVRVARVDDNQGIVHPPRAQVDFTEEIAESDELLSSFIAYQAGIRSDTSQQAISAFAEQILSQLDSEGSIHIEHFGTFTRKNGQVNLEAEDSAINLRYEGLDPVPLPHVHAMAEEQQTPEVETEEVTDSPYTPAPAAPDALQEGGSETRRKRRPPTFVPLLVLLFVAVCVLAYLQYKGSGSSSAQAGIVPDSVEEQAAAVTHDTFRPPDVAGSPTTKDPGTSQNDQSVTDSSETDDADGVRASDSMRAERPVISDSGDVTSDVATIDPSDRQNPISEVLPADSVDDHLAEIYNDTTEMTEASIVPNRPDFVQEEQQTRPEADCVVVVGAFGVENNVVRMEQRLSSLGYEVVKIPTGRLMQVGVPVSCGSSGSQTVLQDLRSSVEATAWILKR